MRFESVLVALAATSVTASQYAPPAAYGGDNSSPAPAPPASYGGQPGGQPEQPPYGGEQPPYGGQPSPSSAPEQPPYGGQPAPMPSPPCSEGEHATETPGYPMPPYGSETEAPVPSPTDDCSEGPAPTETPCLGYDCPKPHGGDYTTYTSVITSSAPCYGGEECAPVTITSTIVEPCPTAPMTTTTYVTKPCPSCEEETLTSTITVTETAPGYPAGTPEGTPAGPGYPAGTPEGSSPEGTPSCPGGYNCPAEGPSTLVPQPAYTPTPGCNGADCAAPGNGSSAGNSSSPYAPGPVVGSGASRFGGSVVASIAVFAAAAFML